MREEFWEIRDCDCAQKKNIFLILFKNIYIYFLFLNKIKLEKDFRIKIHFQCYTSNELNIYQKESPPYTQVILVDSEAT